MKTWFITGVSRGLGHALAQAVLASGDTVIGPVRGQPVSGIANAEKMRLVHADLSDPTDMMRAVQEAFSSFGPVDVVVNNAGYGVFGAVEHLRDEELSRLFEVNVFAPMRICRAAISFFRKRGSGHLVNITSIAGRAPGPASAAYAATKAAMEGFSASLAQEVGPLGIHVTAVAPGQFRTDFLSATFDNSGIDEAYQCTVGAALNTLAKVNNSQIGDPKKAAQVILAAVASPQPPSHLLLGSDAWARASQKLDLMKREMNVWQGMTESTDY